MTLDLIPQPVAESPIRAIERAWPEEDREKVAQFLTVAADDPALIPFLAMSAELGLNPFTGEIWLIETKARDGSGGKLKRPAVGRDGLLKHARRDPAYGGYHAQVVCAGDEFEVAYTGAADDPQVHHRQAKAAGVADQNWRGAILGAWCKVLIKGRAPTFYYAPLKEHGRVGTGSGGKYWQGAWDHTSAMILKAAVSYCHRLATGVSGVVPADELKAGIEAAAVEAAAPEDGEALLAGLDLPDDLAAELAEALDRANALSPFSWGPAKVRMRLAGRGLEVARAALEEVRAQVAADEERRAAPTETLIPARDVRPGMTVLTPEEEWATLRDVAEADGDVLLFWGEEEGPALTLDADAEVTVREA